MVEGEKTMEDNTEHGGVGSLAGQVSHHPEGDIWRSRP